MIIFSSIFLILLFLVTSKIKVNIQNLQKTTWTSKIVYKVKVGIYLLGFIKILGISFTQNGIHFLGFTFKYPKFSVTEISTNQLKSIFSMSNLQNLKVQFTKIQINFKIGFESMMFTVFSVFFMSTIISVLFARNIKNINFKKSYYNIAPIYNKNDLNFKISLEFSIYFFNLIKILKIFIVKQKKYTTEKTALKI